MSRRRRWWITINTGLWLCLPGGAACAEGDAGGEAPLWEAGIGVSAASLPDYLGSSDRREYLLPFPYFVYRGERVQVDRDEVRGKLAAFDRLYIDLNLSGSLPSDSDNTARDGMPDIDAIGSFGPALEYLIYNDETQERRLSLKIPVRAAIATDLSHFEHVGWNANVDLVYQHRVDGWRLTWRAGALFSDDRYHNYIYGVAPQYARADRPAYDASNGLTAWRAGMGVSRTIDNVWYGAFVSYYHLGGGEVGDSPLVTSDHALSAGVAVAWILRRSSRAGQD